MSVQVWYPEPRKEGRKEGGREGRKEGSLAPAALRLDTIGTVSFFLACVGACVPGFTNAMYVYDTSVPTMLSKRCDSNFGSSSDALRNRRFLNEDVEPEGSILSCVFSIPKHQVDSVDDVGLEVEGNARIGHLCNDHSFFCGLES